eukprot:6425309-Amphidinium_carterae.1
MVPTEKVRTKLDTKKQEQTPQTLNMSPANTKRLRWFLVERGWAGVAEFNLPRRNHRNHQKSVSENPAQGQLTPSTTHLSCYRVAERTPLNNDKRVQSSHIKTHTPYNQQTYIYTHTPHKVQRPRNP